MNRLIPRAGRAMLLLPFAVALTAALFDGPYLWAQDGLQRVAVISFTAAVMQTNEAKRDFGALQARFAPRKAELESLSREVDALRKQLSQANNALQSPEQASHAQTLSAKEKQLERAEEDFRNDAQSEEQEAFQRIAQKVDTFLHSYAERHGYSVVLDRGSSEAAPSVLYAIDSIDITRQVIAEYDAQSGVQAPIPSKGAAQDHP